MVRLVNAYPYEITLIALGPLTNIALAMKMDTSFSSKLQYLIWMGDTTGKISGANYAPYFDPAANNIVFSTSDVPVILLDWNLVSLQVPTDVAWRTNVLGKLNSAQVKFLNKIENESITTFREWIVPSAKCMAVATHPSLVTKATYVRIDATIDATLSNGAFIVDFNNATGKPQNCILVQSMNVEGFKSDLLKYFK